MVRALAGPMIPTRANGSPAPPPPRPNPAAAPRRRQPPSPAHSARFARRAQSERRGRAEDWADVSEITKVAGGEQRRARVPRRNDRAHPTDPLRGVLDTDDLTRSRNDLAAVAACKAAAAASILYATIPDHDDAGDELEDADEDLARLIEASRTAR